MPSALPGGGALPEGVDATAFAAAQEACATLAPQGAAGPGGPGAGGPPPAGGGAAVAYRACLRDHGVTLGTGADPSTLDTTDTAVAAAVTTCAPLSPSPTPAAS
jgi:hypothetical protein